MTKIPLNYLGKDAILKKIEVVIFVAKKKKVPKASKHRLLVFGTIACLILIYAIINLCTYSFQIKELSRQKENLNSELNDLKETEENLQTEINKLQDEDYLARYARENYLYTKNGEYVIQVKDDGTVEKQEKEYNFFEENKNILLLGIVLLVIMIVCILNIFKGDKKKKEKS